MFITHNIQYFDAFLMVFKWVLIGLAVQDFDRMCAIWLVFPSCQKLILSKSGVAGFDSRMTLCNIVQAYLHQNVNCGYSLLAEIRELYFFI